MIDALTFFLEFVVSNLLLPGQIENWIFILDLNGMGLATLPLNVQIIDRHLPSYSFT